MSTLAKKTTVLFDPEKYKRLKRIARVQGRTVGELIRESVEIRFGLASVEERLAAVESLGEMSLPAGTWEEMEEETIKGATT